MKALILVALCFGCTKVNFAGTSPSNSTQSESPPVSQPPTPVVAPPSAASPVPCVDTIQKTTENLRIIFMMDNSGSTLATDPNQAVRVQTLKNFLVKYSAKQNFNYAFAYFSDNPSVYNVASGSFIEARQPSQIPKSVFGASTDLSNALNLFTRVAPSGATNYGAAIETVQIMIENDVVANQKWNYVLVFMSDGQPTDIFGAVDPQLRSLIDEVKSAAAMHSALATVSTVLFDPIDDSQYLTSKDYLSSMADEGSGQFFDNNFPPADGLAIDDIISIPGQNCQQ